MTTEMAPLAVLLGSDEGEGVWFADSLLRYKVTGDETHGQLALAEVRAPRGSGSPIHAHRHEDEARFLILVTPAGFEDCTRACGWPATARTLPPPDLSPRSEEELLVAARRHGIDITST